MPRWLVWWFAAPVMLAMLVALLGIALPLFGAHFAGKPPPQRPREFADVCSQRAEFVCGNYSALEHLNIGTDDIYRLRERIGRGKFSAVSGGYDRRHKRDVAVKFIINQEVTEFRVQREIKLLGAVAHGPNVLQMFDFVPDWGKSRGFGMGGGGIPAVVSELIPGDTRQYRTIYNSFTDWELRFFFFELITALQHTHASGIVHKDIKPLNIAYDRATLTLRLLDWGSGDFYTPGKMFTRGGGTKGYKPPEMLLSKLDFTYAYDMWCVGIILVSTLFKLHPIWNKPADDLKHFETMATVLGTKGLEAMLEKYSLTLSKQQRAATVNATKSGVGWLEYVDLDNIDNLSEEALDLVDKLLQWDQEERLTATEALQHPFFAPIRDCLATTAAHFTPFSLPDGFFPPAMSAPREKFTRLQAKK